MKKILVFVLALAALKLNAQPTTNISAVSKTGVTNLARQYLVGTGSSGQILSISGTNIVGVSIGGSGATNSINTLNGLTNIVQTFTMEDGLTVSSATNGVHTIGVSSNRTIPNWINIKDGPYNAIGDSTNNDAAIIQSVFNRLASGVSDIYIPNGIYNLGTNTISIPSSAVRYRIHGDGLSSVLLYSGSTNALELKGPSGAAVQPDSIIENIRILGTNTTGNATGLRLANCYQIKIENVRVENFAFAGFYIDPLLPTDDMGIIHFNHVHSLGNLYGLKVGHTANSIRDILVNNHSRFEGNTGYNLWAWANVSSLSINNCDFYYGSGSILTNIYIDSYGAIGFHDNYIESGAKQLVLANTGGTTVPLGGSFTGNAFQGTSGGTTAIQVGISAADEFDGLTINGNWMFGIVNGVQFVGITRNSLFGPNRMNSSVTQRYNNLVTGSTSTILDQNAFTSGINIGTNGFFTIYTNGQQVVLQSNLKEIHFYDQGRANDTLVLNTNRTGSFYGSISTPSNITSSILTVLSNATLNGQGWYTITNGTNVFLTTNGTILTINSLGGAGGSQTPWLSTINGNSFSITNIGALLTVIGQIKAGAVESGLFVATNFSGFEMRNGPSDTTAGFRWEIPSDMPIGVFYEVGIPTNYPIAGQFLRMRTTNKLEFATLGTAFSLTPSRPLYVDANTNLSAIGDGSPIKVVHGDGTVTPVISADIQSVAFDKVESGYSGAKLTNSIYNPGSTKTLSTYSNPSTITRSLAAEGSRSYMLTNNAIVTFTDIPTSTNIDETWTDIFWSQSGSSNTLAYNLATNIIWLPGYGPIMPSAGKFLFVDIHYISRSNLIVMDWRAPSARMQVTTTNPTNTDDSSKGYDVLSFWVNTAATNSFICVDSTLNAARWNQVDSAGVGNSLPSGGNAGEVLVNVSSGQGVWTNTLNVTSINVSNRFTPDLIGTNNGAIGRPIGLTTALTNGPIADLILNSVRFTPTVLTYAGGTNITIDLNAGTIFKLVLTNTAFFATPSNVPGTNSNQTITVQFQQDATGGRSVTWTNGTFKWPGGTVPTITTNAGAISVVTFNNSTFTNAFLLGSALVNFK